MFHPCQYNAMPQIIILRPWTRQNVLDIAALNTRQFSRLPKRAPVLWMAI
jgi:hypothetical protein